MTYNLIYKTLLGGEVHVHHLHGRDELLINIPICKILANHGFKVRLLPCLPEAEKALREYWLPDVYANKNPDVRINGKWIGDIKSPGKNGIVNKAAINRSIYAASQQKASIVIIDLCDKFYSKQDLKKGIIGALQPDRNKSITAVWIVTNSASLIIIDRHKIHNDSVYEILNAI